MSEEPQQKRGDAAWKEQREAISKRNAEARKRGRAEHDSNASAAQLRTRAREMDEAAQLRALNERIEKRRSG